MFGIAALAACSRDPVTAQTAPEAAPVNGCLEQFVQEFTEVPAQEPPPPPAGICFDTPAGGPPKYPARERKVRLEYDRGDYFAVQESATWTFGEEPDLARNCIVAKLERQKVVLIVQDGRKESTLTRDGTTQRSADTGESYGSRIAFGGGPSQLPTVAAPAADMIREDSPYGTCLRSSGVMPGTSLCSVEQPLECNSRHQILPIEIRFPDAQGGTQIGRTTSLVRGPVDHAGWVLP